VPSADSDDKTGELCVALKLLGAPSAAAFELDTENMASVHALVRFDEVYEEPAMRHHPDVAIRADATAIAVTYSRALADKAAAEYGSRGFVNYEAVKGPILDPRVVVCLDSICRVQSTAFDYVVLDESVAVFLHMNSAVMRRASDVMSRLEGTALASPHVF
jgi:hypothetical protein